MLAILKRLYWLINRPAAYRLQHLEEIQSDYGYLLQSSLWDEQYYLSNYHDLCRQANLSPIDHYLQLGWKMGCNPSRHFLNDEVMAMYQINMNPLLYFLKVLRLGGFRGFLTNTWIPSPRRIARYWEQKASRHSKKVVYTCMTKGYTLLSHYYIDDDWDYVCFTNDEALIGQGTVGPWEVRPLVKSDLDPTRNCRFHKIQPHVVLPEYDESLYVDAKVNILTSYVFDTIDLYDQDFIGSRHMCTPSIFEESKFCFKCGFDPELLQKQLDFYKQEGFPEKHILRETCVLYRKYKKPEIIELMDQWWYWVKNYCRRDQISLPYVIWKNGGDEKHPTVLNNPFSDYDDFAIINSREIQLKRYGLVIPKERAKP